MRRLRGSCSPEGALRGRNESQAVVRNKSKIRRNEIKAGRNKNQEIRNKIKILFRRPIVCFQLVMPDSSHGRSDSARSALRSFRSGSSKYDIVAWLSDFVNSLWQFLFIDTNIPGGLVDHPLTGAAGFAASSVFDTNIAIVMRPTPPGTGVIAPATSAASGSVVKTKSSMTGLGP
jgi:hypothetical protein